MNLAERYIERRIRDKLFLFDRKGSSVISLNGKIARDVYTAIKTDPHARTTNPVLRSYPSDYQEALTQLFDKMKAKLTAARMSRLDFNTMLDTYAANNRVLQAHYEITTRCNLSCSFCYNMDERKTAQGSVSEPEFTRVIDQLHSSGLVELTLTGGEPFIHPGIDTFLRHLSKLDLKVTINTNGTRGSQALEDSTVRKCIYCLDVSVYSFPDESFPDETSTSKGHTGYLQALLKNTHQWRALGLPVRLKFILSRGNQADVERFLRYCKKHDVQHIVSDGVFWESGAAASSLTPGVAVRRKLFQEDRWPYRAILKSGGTLENRCRLQKSRIAIDANGNVFPCEIVRIHLGNLQDNHIGDIVARQQAVCAEWITAKANEDGSQDCTRCDKKHFCMKCPGHSFSAGAGVDAPHAPSCELATLLADLHREEKCTDVAEQ